RHDAHGVIASLNPEEIHRHAPLVTLLRYGRRLQQTELSVRLTVSFTETGTLELWCESTHSPHRWQLQFELREARAGDESESTSAPAFPSSRHAASMPTTALSAAIRLIRAAFSRAGEVQSDPVDPASLVGALESITGLKRESWPVATVRAFCDALLE